MPTSMNYKYNSCSVKLDPTLSNEYFPNGLSVDVKSEATTQCDVYAFG